MEFNELAIRLVEKLKANKLTISFGESVTGGLLASTLVSAAGASCVFKESYVVYSNEAKHRILGVKYDTIDKCDVVSKEVALEMAKGLSKLTKANINVSTTGYASFDEKNNRDTGICCYTIYYKDIIINEELEINGSRNEVREKLVDIIFTKLNEILE